MVKRFRTTTSRSGCCWRLRPVLSKYGGDRQAPFALRNRQRRGPISCLPAALASDPSLPLAVSSPEPSVDAAAQRKCTSCSWNVLPRQVSARKPWKSWKRRKYSSAGDAGTVIEPPYEYRSIVRGCSSKVWISAIWPTRIGSGYRPAAQQRGNGKFKICLESCQHVKSNSIVFAKGQATVGIGAGSLTGGLCSHSRQRAGEQSVGAVMGSDAYFPSPIRSRSGPAWHLRYNSARRFGA